MRLSDGQIIGLIAAIPILLTGLATYLASLRTKRIDQQMKQEELQTVREGQLLAQITELNRRMDSREQYWQNRFDVQEKHCEERIDALEAEVDKLRAENHALRAEMSALRQERQRGSQ